MTVTAPAAAPAADPPEEAADAAASPPPAAAGHPPPSRAGAYRRAAAVPLLVLAPLVALAPGEDHRFNVYRHGGDAHTEPWQIVGSIIETIPVYVERGNFRPLGRIVERALDLIAFEIVGVTGVPANVALRLVSIGAAMVLTVTAVAFAHAMISRSRCGFGRPTVLAALVPLAVGGGLVASGPASLTVLFGGLYFLSSALVLALATLALRVRDAPSRRSARVRAAVAVSAGAGLAVFNEVAYLMLPVGTVALLIRHRLVLRDGWGRLGTAPGVRLVGWAWLGFLPVFAVTRYVIWRVCSDGGCYRASDLHLGPDVPATWAGRALSWLPPLQWNVAVSGDGPSSWLLRPFTVVALVAVGLLAWRMTRGWSGLEGLDRAQAAAVAAAGAFLVLLAGLFGSVNPEVQTFSRTAGLGFGWREGGLTAVGGALLLGALGCLAVRPGASRRCARSAAVVVAFAVLAAGSATANLRYREAATTDPARLLANEIALEVAQLSPAPDADARRCALLARAFRLHPGPANAVVRDRYVDALDAASRALAGIPFCSRTQS